MKRAAGLASTISCLFLASCAATPVTPAKHDIDFVWGCWIAKDAPGGRITAFFRLLPERPDDADAAYAGEIRSVTQGEFSPPAEGLSFARDGSAATFWFLFGSENSDRESVRVPGSAVDKFVRVNRPDLYARPGQDVAVFKSIYDPKRSLVVRATAERLKISRETAGERPNKPIFDGERDGCD